ncbi:MAG: TIGR00730 family Rossman fold protein [Proteobacteria bacterium]|nr:TIGR00730 family Rossman fold protein [Pseudomonadota bacterium]
MTTIRSLCVFCGSSAGFDPAHREAAARLGRLLAEAGVALVYGGGRVGLMGALADGALAAGGRVVGVIPRHLVEREVEHTGVSELVEVETMHARKAEMFARADAFAVLPGGIGTLDEAFEILSWRLLGLHDKPVAVVDHAGYWRPLVALLECMMREGFARADSLGLFRLVGTVEEVLPALVRAARERVPPHPDLM